MSGTIYLLHILSNTYLIKHCTWTQKTHRKVKNPKYFRHSEKTEVVEMIRQQAKKFTVNSIFTLQKSWYETHRGTLFTMGLEKKKLLQIERHWCLGIFGGVYRILEIIVIRYFGSRSMATLTKNSHMVNRKGDIGCHWVVWRLHHHWNCSTDWSSPAPLVPHPSIHHTQLFFSKIQNNSVAKYFFTFVLKIKWHGGKHYYSQQFF